MEKREELTISAEQVINLYQELLAVLKSDQFGEYLRKELNKSYPEYLEVLKKRIEDMNTADHGIVIAGETSSGKSTLINKILQMNIFGCTTHESTSTICKLRNIEKITIKVEKENDEVETVDVPEDLDITTSAGIENLKELLMWYTDLTTSAESKDYLCVDIGFPIPFLKGNVIIVDTPGIGGSGEVSQKVFDYLSSALSFIFVVDAGSAGGMQGDRLPVILKKLVSLQIENEMPCFNPEDVIFLTNKWDTIINACDESATQMEREKTWKILKHQINSQWSTLKDEHTFKLNLKDESSKKADNVMLKVSADAKNDSTTQFQQFLRKLENMIRNAENARVVKHVCFLQGILGNIENMVIERCHWKTLDEEEKNTLVAMKKDTLRVTKQECEEFEEKVRKMKEELAAQTAKDTYDYMLSDEGKENVLNPDGCIPILKVKFWNSKGFSEELKSRVHLHVTKVMKSDEFIRKYTEIRDMTISFYINACRKLEEKFGNDTDNLMNIPEAAAGMTPESEIHHLLFALPIMLVGFYSFPLTFVLAGIYIVFHFSITKAKEEIIDNSYKKYATLVRDKIKKDSCDILHDIIDKIMLDLLPRRIEAYEERIKQLQELHEKICDEHTTLRNLAEKVTFMKTTANEMNISLNVQKTIALEN